MERKHNPKLTPLAKNLRKNMTKEERKLWYEFLRDYPERFLRQKVIDDYIVDFYCHKAKLAVELDGSQHYEDKEKIYDEERTKRLSEFGIEVIRFSNSDVLKNFEGVCMRIDEAVRFRANHPSVACGDSSPEGEP